MKGLLRITNYPSHERSKSHVFGRAAVEEREDPTVALFNKGNLMYVIQRYITDKDIYSVDPIVRADWHPNDITFIEYMVGFSLEDKDWRQWHDLENRRWVIEVEVERPRCCRQEYLLLLAVWEGGELIYADWLDEHGRAAMAAVWRLSEAPAAIEAPGVARGRKWLGLDSFIQLTLQRMQLLRSPFHQLNFNADNQPMETADGGFRTPEPNPFIDAPNYEAIHGEIQ